MQKDKAVSMLEESIEEVTQTLHVTESSQIMRLIWQTINSLPEVTLAGHHTPS